MRATAATSCCLSARRDASRRASTVPHEAERCRAAQHEVLNQPRVIKLTRAPLFVMVRNVHDMTGTRDPGHPCAPAIGASVR
jgi:hypothetical protein